MVTKNINIDAVILEVQKGVTIRKICEDHHIGERRLRNILLDSGIDLSKRKRAIKHKTSEILIGQKFNH